MFALNSPSKLAGGGYITLQVLRVLNIISLLLVAIASWVMLVMTVKTSNFFFFDGVSHFITSVVSCFLIISELNIWNNYFARNWPNLGPESGFVCLGLAMIILGFNILGNLNKGATSVENLGLPLWRVVIAAGILASLIGLFNIIATYVFSNSKLGISGRQVRDKGASTFAKPTPKDNFSMSSGSVRKDENSFLPSYNAPPSPPQDRRKSHFNFKLPIRISQIGKPVVPANDEQFSKWEDRSSPVAPDVQRPPTALHPALNAPGPAYPPAPSSRYSVVSNMTRF
jgi:hypothetical protein